MLHAAVPRLQQSDAAAVPAVNPKTKVLVLGHGQHGKDTAAEFLTQEYGLTFVSSSWFVMERAVWPILSLTNGYTTLQECFDDRHQWREVWYRLIRMYNEVQRDRLVTALLEQHDIYVGMRDYDEFLVSKEHFDLILWIDASERKPMEGSMKIPFDPTCMQYINNNHSDPAVMQLQLRHAMSLTQQ